MFTHLSLKWNFIVIRATSRTSIHFKFRRKESKDENMPSQ